MITAGIAPSCAARRTVTMTIVGFVMLTAITLYMFQQVGDLTG